MMSLSQTIWRSIGHLYHESRRYIDFSPVDRVILLYHSIGEKPWSETSVKEFEKQIQFLKNHYEIVDLDELFDTKRGVVLTFDDGYRDFYDTVVPLLEEYNVPATVFMNGAFIDDRSEILYSRLGVPEGEKGVIMSTDQVRELAEHDLVTIGNHTYSHPNLNDLSKTEIKEEIVRGKHVLEEEFDLTIERFAYPYGRYNEESHAVVEATHRCGLIADRSTNISSDPVLLPRVGAPATVTQLDWQLSRFADKFKRSLGL
ncbi:polysaccharide deacetylase family protein [Halostella litorea]|uniref:polysaccharide deacetylase family protein n=1 Tax=Halostella litorea TaxID=2528831 RepID=UPI00192A3DC5|nr:polysaccharide deacetylase family protein [Halostella litorea]